MPSRNPIVITGTDISFSASTNKVSKAGCGLQALNRKAMIEVVGSNSNDHVFESSQGIPLPDCLSQLYQLVNESAGSEITLIGYDLGDNYPDGLPGGGNNASGRRLPRY